MIRIKFVKNYGQYKRGDIETFSPNEAFGLIDAGKAIVSKDITNNDYTTKMVVPTFNPKPDSKLNTKEK